MPDRRAFLCPWDDPVLFREVLVRNGDLEGIAPAFVLRLDAHHAPFQEIDADQHSRQRVRPHLLAGLKGVEATLVVHGRSLRLGPRHGARWRA
ncbi:MAG: hypothetical protein ACP5U2_05810 [Bryobacteraceae bacterium]